MTTSSHHGDLTDKLVKKAEEFHGHLGPFLTLGIRMGQIGLRELGLAKSENSLRIHLMVQPTVPYSCVIDGLQISTGCTIGNRGLILKNAKRIEAEFKNLNTDKTVTVLPQPSLAAMLKEQTIKRNPPQNELRKLAQMISAMPEKDLCIIRFE